MSWNTLYRARFCLAASAVAIAILNCPASFAQAINIVDEANAGRAALAEQIANVDNQALRSKLLKTANNERLTHWYAGEIQYDGEWFTLEAIEEQAAKDTSLVAYRERRQKMTDSLRDHERMARWSKKQGLSDLADLHWMYVLRHNRQHKVALKELDLAWYGGQLLASEEVELVKDRRAEWKEARQEWQEKAKNLRRDLEEGGLDAQLAARKELRAIDQPAAVPALIAEFAEPGETEEQTSARRTELMAALGNIESPAAVETLVNVSVLSPDDTVRYAAIDQLKAKPLETYVPSLLSKLSLPIESSVNLRRDFSRVVANYAFSQETLDGNYITDYAHSYLDTSGRNYEQTPLTRGRYTPTTTNLVLIPGSTGGCGRPPTPPSIGVVNSREGSFTREQPEQIVTDSYQKRQRDFASVRNSAAQQLNGVAERNAQIDRSNKRVIEVLTEVSGETLSTYPKSWWNWWGDYLERHPNAATSGTRRQLNAALMNQSKRGLSRGTWVWTRRGKRSIEEVLPGDYVLAQDPQSGELAYKVVLAIAAPQQLQLTRVMLDDDELHCASGHVVWTNGTGWQRVSKLEPGQSLHGAKTTTRVTKVEDAFKLDSYDLIVDGFHTFFVGEQPLLVHDATPVAPAHVALPGFSPAAVADAIKLASNP